MRRIPILLSLILILAAPAAAQDASPVAISAPAAGQALQGAVTVRGTVAVDPFASAELQFAYADDPTGTWFLIAQIGRPVQDGTLTVWDTTSITDGVYALRLIVRLPDGSLLEARVEDLRVRNYTPVETPTPSLADLPTATATPTRTPVPTPTVLPGNPVEVTAEDVYLSLGRGALFATLCIFIFGLFLWLRRRAIYD